MHDLNSCTPPFTLAHCGIVTVYGSQMISYREVSSGDPYKLSYVWRQTTPRFAGKDGRVVSSHSPQLEREVKVRSIRQGVGAAGNIFHLRGLFLMSYLSSLQWLGHVATGWNGNTPDTMPGRCHRGRFEAFLEFLISRKLWTHQLDERRLIPCF